MELSTKRNRIWIVAILALTSSFLVANEQLAESEISEVYSTVFSFGVPESYNSGTATQKEFLKSIARTEFTLEHLDDSTQDLLNEALSKSGMEVHETCVVERAISGKFSAFFRSTDHSELRVFHPMKGNKNEIKLSKPESNTAEWNQVVGDVSSYPYPFSEDEKLPKAIPIDLSSIEEIEAKETEYRFAGRPSRLLTAGLSDSDRILGEEHLRVEFSVDLETRRVMRQMVSLEKPISVHFGIKVRDFRVNYEFGLDHVVGQNVMQSMRHNMAGSVALLFRPKIDVTSHLVYRDCDSEGAEQSFLYRAIEAISNLDTI